MFIFGQMINTENKELNLLVLYLDLTQITNSETIDVTMYVVTFLIKMMMQKAFKDLNEIGLILDSETLVFLLKNIV